MSPASVARVPARSRESLWSRLKTSSMISQVEDHGQEGVTGEQSHEAKYPRSTADGLRAEQAPLGGCLRRESVTQGTSD